MLSDQGISQRGTAEKNCELRRAVIHDIYEVFLHIWDVGGIILLPAVRVPYFGSQPRALRNSDPAFGLFSYAAIKCPGCSPSGRQRRFIICSACVWLPLLPLVVLYLRHAQATISPELWVKFRAQLKYTKMTPLRTGECLVKDKKEVPCRTYYAVSQVLPLVEESTFALQAASATQPPCGFYSWSPTSQIHSFLLCLPPPDAF